MGKEMLITRNRNLKIGVYYFVKVRKRLKFYLVLLSLLLFYTWVWVTEEKEVGWLIVVDIQKFGVTFGVWGDKHFN